MWCGFLFPLLYVNRSNLFHFADIPMPFFNWRDNRNYVQDPWQQNVAAGLNILLRETWPQMDKTGHFSSRKQARALGLSSIYRLPVMTSVTNYRFKNIYTKNRNKKFGMLNTRNENKGTFRSCQSPCMQL